MPSPHHVEGIFHLFDSADGGRSTPVESGYSPNHRVHENYLTSARHAYPEVEQISPGASAKVYAWFITPEVHPRSLWAGREIDVTEGERVVGRLTVTKVLHPVLAGSAETYAPVWIAPPSASGPEPGYAGIVFLGTVYAVFAGLALWLAIDAYTPCESNFEGGCSMGKGMLAMGSCLLAAVAAVVALAVRVVLLQKLQTRPYAKMAGIALCGVPLLYTLFTLKLLFFG